MATSPSDEVKEFDDKPEEGTLDFDDDTLRAIAEVYFLEGDKELEKKDLFNAIYFYTEGIKVKCKNDELNAKLYNNRATAYFYLEKYQESLNDARAAIDLQPAFLEAIERGTTVKKLDFLGSS